MDNATADTAPSAPKGKWGGLGKRALYGLLSAVSAFIFISIGGLLFTIAVTLAAIQMWYEWYRMTKRWGIAATIIGLLYILLPCLSLIYLRNHMRTEDSAIIIFALIIIVSGTDISAYFWGKLIGGPKLAPSISPNKTWAGAIGGTLTVLLITIILKGPSLGVIASVLVLSISSQVGDLFESWVKRRAGVKDSGTLIPGHGGLLDRLDGYMFAAPLLVLILYFIS